MENSDETQTSRDSINVSEISEKFIMKSITKLLMIFQFDYLVSDKRVLFTKKTSILTFRLKLVRTIRREIQSAVIHISKQKKIHFLNFKACISLTLLKFELFPKQDFH